MEKYPVLWQGESAGEVTAEAEGLYTRFHLRSRLPDRTLWCGWLVGERGELRLGVLEPVGEQAVIHRRFSRAMTAPLGKLLRGELRPAGEGGSAWETVKQDHFTSPWLRRQLGNLEVLRTRMEGNRRLLAIPCQEDKPFPLTALFCFAKVCTVEGRRCVVYAFNEREEPVF